MLAKMEISYLVVGLRRALKSFHSIDQCEFDTTIKCCICPVEKRKLFDAESRVGSSFCQY